MASTAAMPLRVGGQALPDGVYMRTPRAWAVARADGTVVVGDVIRTPFSRVPVVRVLAALAGALVNAVMTAGRPGKRTLVLLAGLTLVGWAAPAMPAGNPTVIAVVAVVASFACLRLLAPAALWRYHGAEHKAVAAYERGVPLDDVRAVLHQSRVHDRCGTNIVTLLAPVSVAIASWPAALQVPAMLLALGLAAELVTVVGARPYRRGRRGLLAGGRLLQRFVTTAEPSPAEQAVACRALSAALAHHAALEAAGSRTIAIAA